MVLHSAPNDEAAALLKEAQNFARNKQWESAIDFAKQASKAEPDWIDPYGNLAWFSVCRCRYDEALELYQKILDLDPSSTEAAGIAGKLCEELLDYKRALGFYKQAKHERAHVILNRINKRINYSFLHYLYQPIYYFCVALRTCRQHSLSLKILRFVSLFLPKAKRPFYLLARLTLEQKKQDEEQAKKKAAALLIRGIQYKSNFEYFALLTSLMYQLEDYEAAVEYGSDTQSFRENDIQTLQSMAMSFVELEKYEEALEIYDRLSQLQPRNAIHVLHKALIHQHARRFKIADELYLRAIALHPKSILNDYLYQTLLYEKTVEEYHSSRAILIESSHYDYAKPVYRPPWRVIDLLLSFRRRVNFFFMGTLPQLFLKEKYKRVACAVCGSRRKRYVATCSGNGWRIVRCARCELVYTFPQPTADVLYGKYQGEYWETERNTGAEEFHKIAAQEQVISPLDEKMFRWLDDLGFPKWEEAVGAEKLLLDVGCGLGIFMREMQNRGWQVQGSEVADYAVEFCRKLGYTIHKGTLDAIPDQKFDMISLHHVIEHVNEPHILVQQIYERLNTNGLVLVRTPCCDTIPAYIAGKAWFYDPDHIYFFNQKTVCRLLENAGFNILSTMSYVGIEHETWNEAWYGLQLNSIAREKVEKYNYGDVICVLAEKKD